MTTSVQLKALLLESITLLKFGYTQAQNFKQAKHRLCEEAGQKKNIKTIEFIRFIGMIYKDNCMQKEFDRIIEKFKIGDKVYN